MLPICQIHDPHVAIIEKFVVLLGVQEILEMSQTCAIYSLYPQNGVTGGILKYIPYKCII